MSGSGEDGNEEMGFLRDVVPLFYAFWLSEATREGAGGERAGPDQRFFHFHGGVPADVGKTTLGREDEVVE